MSDYLTISDGPAVSVHIASGEDYGRRDDGFVVLIEQPAVSVVISGEPVQVVIPQNAPGERGEPGPAAPEGDGLAPFYIAANSIERVPAHKQMLIKLPLRIDGGLRLDGPVVKI